MQSIEHHFNKDSINVTEHINPVCHYANRGKDKLLITIGESWTWGATLEEHNHSRLDCVWGNHLSKSLDRDWLNIARKGASNLWIFYQIEELIRYKNNIEDFNYDHIQIIVCCTEWGREYLENWQWHHMDPGHDIKPPVMQNFDILNYCRPFLDELGADILLTHNFCDSSFWIHDLPQLEKNWIEVTCENLNVEYDFVVPTMIHYERLRRTEIKLKDLVALQDKSLALVDFFNKSKYNYKKNVDKNILVTGHPTPESHKFWAEYIYGNIKDSL